MREGGRETHTHREREGERERETHTQRERGRERDRDTHTQRERGRERERGHTHTERERERERERDTHTERERERERERHTHTEREGEREREIERERHGRWSDSGGEFWSAAGIYICSLQLKVPRTNCEQIALPSSSRACEHVHLIYEISYYKDVKINVHIISAVIQAVHNVLARNVLRMIAYSV